jgi:hypothetical protein
MAWGFPVALRNTMLTAIVTDAGANAILRLYDGTRPATGGTATNVLSEHTCSATLGTVAAAVLTFNTIGNDTSANATGTATWARLFRSDGTTIVADCSAGADVTTTATGTASTDTITVGSATGIVIGQNVTGTGIATGARVVDIQGTTVHVSIEHTGAVSGNATFKYDISVNPGSITAGQAVNVTGALTITAGNA